MASAAEQLKRIRTQQEMNEIAAAQIARTAAITAQTSMNAYERNREIKLQHDIEVQKRIVSETNIIGELQDIERQECSGFRKHAVVVNYGDTYKTVTLAWGKNFGVYNKKIEPEKTLSHLLKGYIEIDYSYVEVGINPDTEGIKIGSEEVLPANIWRSNPEAIPNALVKSFQNPGHTNASDYTHDSSPNYH